MEWWLRRIARDDFRVHLWEDGSGIAALVIDDDGYVIARTADRRAASRMRVLEWVEGAFRTMGRSAVETAAADDERDLREALAMRGYVPSGMVGSELVYDVGDRPRAAALPAGFRLATIDAIGDDAFVALHRASWSDTRPSDYSRLLHDIVAAMPDFRRDLVPVILAPDGTPAAYCIAWFDEASLSVEIEPLGTHAAFRRLGLGRVIVREVQRQARRLGARTVMVWATDPSSTAHLNEPARRLYTSCDMTPRRTVRDYRLAL